MKTNGSVYVAIVVALLVGYFSYQWWFNPARAVKRRLGDVAAVLSIPAEDTDIGRVTRVAQLRRYLADDIHVRAGASAQAVTSRDVVLGIVAAFIPPPGGWDVGFADVQVTVESESTARADLSIEITTRTPQGQPSMDAQDAAVVLAKRDGEWVITSAATKLPPVRPQSP
jgi:hypothetical protein